MSCLRPKQDASHGSKRRYIRGYRLLWWLGALLAGAVPLRLAGKVGVYETWEAFDRYTRAVLEFPRTHPISVPTLEILPHNYTGIDQDLINWQTGLTALYERIRRMAVVGVVDNSELGLEFEFDQHKADPGGTKGRFYAKRDLSILLYLGLSAMAYFSSNVHLALVVLNFNFYTFLICLRLKGLSDAIGKTLDALKDARQAFVLVPLGGSVLELLQQHLILQKMEAIISEWSGTELGISITIPVLHLLTKRGGTITLSTSTMASLALATTARAIHVVVYGFIPGLPRIRWRVLLGQAEEARARLQSQASEMRQKLSLNRGAKVD